MTVNFLLQTMFKLNHLLLLLFIGISFASKGQDIYYSKTNGNFNSVSSWSSTQDGSGGGPSSIGNDIFIIQSGHTITCAVDVDFIHSIEIEGTLSFTDGVTLNVANDLYYYQNGSILENLTSTIKFTDDNSTISIIEGRNNSGGSNTIPFNNLSFSKGGNKVIVNETAIDIGGNFLIENTEFESKNAIYLASDLSIDANSNYTTESGNYLYIDGIGNQTISIPDNITSVDGNENAQFGRVVFKNGGQKTITGGFYSQNEIQVEKHEATTVSFSNNNHSVNSLRINDDVLDSDNAITFNGGNVFLNGRATFYQYNTIDNSLVGTFDLGTANFFAETGELSLGDGNSDGDIISINGNITVSNDNSLVSRLNTTFTATGGTLTINDNSRVYLKGSNDPSFDSYVISEKSTFYYESPDPVTIIDLDYGHLRLYNNSTKTINTDLLVKGELGVYDDAQLIVEAGNILTIYGNIRNRGVSESPNPGTIDATDATIQMVIDDVNREIYLSKQINGADNPYKISILNVVAGASGLTANRSLKLTNHLEVEKLIVSNPSGSLSTLLTVDIFDESSEILNLMGASTELTQGDFTRITTKSKTLNFLSANTVDIDQPYAFLLLASSANQSIPADVSFGNVQFNGNGNKTLLGDITINGRIERTGGTNSLIAGSNTIEIYGDWKLNTSGASHKAGIESSTVAFKGNNDQVINDASFGNLVFNSTGNTSIAKTITVYGDVILEGGDDATPLNVVASNNINLYGNWEERNETSKFSHTFGTLSFISETSDQTVTQNSLSSFGNIRLIKSSSFQTIFNSKVQIDGELRMDGGKGKLTINDDLTVRGDFNNYGTGNTFTQAAAAELIFDGSKVQNIRIDDANLSTFTELVTFSNQGSKLFQGTNIYTFEKGLSIIGATVDGSNKTFNLEGDWLNSDGVFESTGTVNFTGAGEKSIDPTTFYKLSLDNTAEVTLNGNISIYRFEQLAGTVFNLNANTIYVAYHWEGNGTFNHQNGHVIFTGQSSTVTEDDPFYNLSSLLLSTQILTFTAGNDLLIENDLIVSESNFNLNGNAIELGGNLSSDGDIYSASSLTFNATTAGDYIIKNGISRSNNGTAADNNKTDIIINADPAANYHLSSNIRMTGSTGDLTIKTGSLNLNGNSLELTNNNKQVIVENGAELIIDAGASLQLTGKTSQPSLYGHNGSTIRIEGDDNNYALLEAQGTQYQVLVEGLLSARNYKITDLTGYGIQLGTNGSLGTGDYNLSDGIFVNGSNTSSASITIGADANIGTTTINNVTFGVGPSVAVDNQSSTIGDVTFFNAKGSNRETENDAANKIHWGFDAFISWTGAVSTDWHDADNWSGNVIPTKGDNILIPGALTNYPLLDGTAGVAKRIEIENGASLIIEEQLEAYDGIYINSGATITGSAANNDLIIVYGDWINEGTFVAGTSTLKFAFEDGSTAKVISFIPGTDTYFGISIDAKDHTILQSDNKLNVNNYTLISGAYDVSDQDINLFGTWEKSGGYFEYRTSDINCEDAIIKGGDFYNLIVSDGHKLTLEGNITVNNTLKLVSATSEMDAAQYLIYLKGNYENKLSGTFTHTGTLILNGAYQRIYGTAAFGNVIFQGSSNKVIQDGANIDLSGDATVLDGITVIFEENALFKGDGSFTMTGSTARVEGADNYPDFAQYQITGGTFHYNSGAQNIGDFQYYTLYLTNGDKSLNGDINVSNQLRIDTEDSKLTNILVNGNEIALGSSFNIFDKRSDTSAEFITWAGGTLRHYGGVFNLPSLLTNYHHLIFEGSGTKSTTTPINVAGDLTIKEDVIFRQGKEGEDYAVVGAGGTLTLERNSRYESYGTSTAFASGFNTYNLDENSDTYIYSTGPSLNLLLNIEPNYGNLYLRNDGILSLDGDLHVKGKFDERMTGMADLEDNDNNLFIGGSVFLSNYSNPTSTAYLNGNDPDINQTIDGNGTITFNNIELSGLSQKDFIYDDYVIKGNVLAKADATINLTRNLVFTGENWNSEEGAIFNATSILEIAIADGSKTQTLNFGSNHTINNLELSGASLKNIACDLNVDKTLNTSGGSVDFGAYTHHIAVGAMDFQSPVVTTASNFNLDGGNQYIPDGLSIKNLVLSNGGNKYLLGDITVHDVIALDNARLSPDGNGMVDPTLTVKGNWDFELGHYSTKSAKVIFDGVDNGTFTIFQKGNIRLFDVSFEGTGTTYLLEDELYTYKSANIASDATLDLNGHLFYVGVRTDLEIYPGLNPVENLAIYGELLVSKGGALQLNARDTNGDEKPTITVYSGGHLSVVGEEGKLSKVSAEDKGSDDHRLVIDIQDGGEISAKYYEFKGLDHEGMKVSLNAIVNDTNNFSEGVFTGMSSDNSINRVYLDIEAAVTNPVTNVTFDYNNTPNSDNDIYNVRRSEAANGILTFSGSTGIAGSIQGETFEDDEAQRNNGGEGNIIWPISNDIVWEGDVSDDWHDGNNWSGGSVPLASHNVIIPSKTAASTFYPLISASAVCRDLIIKGGRLTLNTPDGFDHNNPTLVIGGDFLLETGVFIINDEERITVGENYSVTSNGTFVPNQGTVELIKAIGTVVLDQNNSPFYNLEITNNASISLQSKLVVNGDFKMTNSGGITLPNNHNVTFNGDVELSENAIFDINANGWVYLKGTATQRLTKAHFKSVKFQGTRYEIVDSIKVSNHSYLEKGTIAQVDENSSYIFSNRVEVDNDNFFFEQYVNGGTHFVRSGKWYGYGTTSNITGTGSSNFIFENVGGTIEIDGDKAFFDALTLKTAKLSLNADVEATSLDATNTDVYAYQYQITGKNTGAFILGDSKIIYLTGVDNFPKGFGRYDLNENSITTYAGGTNQIIQTREGAIPIFYGDLKLEKEGSEKTISSNGDLIVRGDLIINQSIFNTNNLNVKIGGDFIHNYLHSSLVHGTSTFTFNGLNDQFIYLSSIKDNSFHNLSVDKPSGSKVTISGADISINGDLNVRNGVFSLGNRKAILRNNLIVQNGFLAEEGTYEMIASGTAARIQTNGSKFKGLKITGKSSTIYRLVDNLIISDRYILNLERGTLKLDSASVLEIGSSSQLNISANSSCNIVPASKVRLGNNAALNVLGNLDVLGNQSQAAIIESIQSDYYYSFNIEGNINANYYTISGMSSNGVFVKSSATIDNNGVGYNFSNGTFSGYYTGGVALKIDNDQSFIANFDGGSGAYLGGAIENVNFIQIASSGTANVSKEISTTGQIDFYNAGGQLEGDAYERDPFNLINWLGRDEVIWVGAKNSDWFDGGNWSTGAVPQNDDDVIIEVATNQPIIDGGNAEVNNLTLETATLLQINSSDDANVDLKINGNAAFNGQIEATSENDSIAFAGNWIVNPTGSFKHGNGVLKANGSGAQVIDNAGLGFGSLVITGQSIATLKLSGKEIINRDFNIEEYATLSFEGVDHTIDIGGNVAIQGVLNVNQNVIKLVGHDDGMGSQFTMTTSDNILNALEVNTIDNNYAYSLLSGLSISKSLKIESGKLLVNADTINLLGNASSTFEINNGVLDLSASTLLMSNASSFVMNGGDLVMANGAKVSTDITTASYRFSLLGGTFTGNDFTFEYMDENGILMDGVTLSSVGVEVDDDNDVDTPEVNIPVLFANSVFQNGKINGLLLNLESYNSGAVAAGTDNLENKFYNVYFNGPSPINVRNNTGNAIYFVDAKGAISGEKFELEANGTIDWELIKDVYTWIGNNAPYRNGHANWKEADNWTYNGGVNNTSLYPGQNAEHATSVMVKIVQPLPGNLPAILYNDATGNTITVYSVDVDPLAGFVIEGDAQSDINDETHYELIITNEFSILPAAYVDFDKALVRVEGIIRNNGEFDSESSVMVMKPTTTDYIELSAGKHYNDLYIQGTVNTEINIIGDTVYVDGLFHMDNGMLSVTGNNLNIGGHFTLESTVTINPMSSFNLNLNGGNQTLTLNNVDKQELDNIAFDGTGTKTINSDSKIKGDFSINDAVVVNIGDNLLEIGGDWFNHYGESSLGVSYFQMSNTGKVIFNSTSNQQSIDGYSSAETFTNFEVNNPHGIDTRLSLNIQNDLILTKGIINTPHIILSAGVGGTTGISSSTDSYVSGKITRNDLVTAGDFYEFPVGSQETWARTAINTKFEAALDYSVEFADTDKDANLLVNDGSDDIAMEVSPFIWEITNENAKTDGADGVDIKLYFEDLSPYSLAIEAVRKVVHFYDKEDGNDFQWYEEVTDYTGDDNSAIMTAEGVTKFSEFGATLEEYVDQGNDLPVDLTYFKGEIDVEGNVSLEWETASEYNASHFEIEKSINGKSYTKVGTIHAEGNSSVSLTYSYEDKADSKLIFYRLKQVDFDGQYTYYGPVILQYSDQNQAEDNQMELFAFPNPMEGSEALITITGLHANENFEGKIVTLTGQVMESIESEADVNGIATLDLVIADWNTGVYILKIKSKSGKVSYIKLMK